MVDVAAVPDRFKNGIVKAEDQDVLHGLFAEIVIDSVNLIFGKHGFDLAVERTSRIVIVAEWFLNNDPPPAAILLLREFRDAKLLDDGSKKLGRRR